MEFIMDVNTIENKQVDPGIDSGFKAGGVFHFKLIRDGKVIDTWDDHNIVVNEGLNYLLAASLGGETQQASWYIGLFSGNYTPVATLTAATVAGNATESILYDETTRQQWVEPGASNQEITNSASPASFTINDTVTIYGAFLISDSTKGGTAGKLFAAARFAASRALIAADVLQVTYTVGAASA
jgi:hypothetical protein